MKNIPNKRMSVAKRILLVIFAVPILLILYIVGTLAAAPIFDNIDRVHFEELDAQSSALYETIKSTPGSSIDWTYAAACDDVLAGPWPTGEYVCKTTLFAETPTVDASQFIALHETYYPIINASSDIAPTTELEKFPGTDFGVNFVVSHAERNYTSKVHNAITCGYLAILAHPKETGSTSYNQNYGSPIETDSGRTILRFECTGKARSNWYNPDPLD